MIKRLKYHEIDFQKYRKCIDASFQNNFFARKEVLDWFCEKWELLIYDDYLYVMPIPLKKKFFFQFVQMPLFMQQLGIFGPSDSTEINSRFLQEFSENYRIGFYAFNQYNIFEKDLSYRKNYVIPQQKYDDLKKKFYKGRKAVLKKNHGISVSELHLSEQLKEFIKHHFKGISDEYEVRNFSNFLEYYKNKIRIKGVFFSEKLISLAIFTETEQNYGLLALINDEDFKNKNAATFMINTFLQSEIEKKSLDLMGGNIPGIELFFKSFGAELSAFPVIQNSKTEILKNLIKL